MKIKFGTLLFPVAIIIAFIFIKVEWKDLYNNIIQEDSFLENLQFYFYACSSIIALLAALDFRKNGLLKISCIMFLLTVLFILISLEEISWGQRFFSVNSSEWFQRNNSQGEINLHNLKPVQHILCILYILFGTFLSFGWVFVKYLFAKVKLDIEKKTILKLFTPRWYLMLFFLPTIIIYIYFQLATNDAEKVLKPLGLKALPIGNFIIWQDQEPIELILALGCFLFVSIIFIKFKANKLRIII